MKFKRIFTIGIIIAFVLIGLLIVLYEVVDRIPEKENEVQLDDKSIADEQLEEIEGSENFTKVALIGKEYLFEDDIKRYLSSQGRTSEFGDEKAKSEALDYLVDESVKLQQAEENGWIELRSSFFNNPVKDNAERNLALYDVKINFDAFNTSGNKIVEGITLFFVNTIPGELVEEKGRDYVKDLVHGKIQKAYEDVNSGNKTIEEAGRELINDPDMPKIDHNYLNGIYVKPFATNPNTDESDRFYGWEETIVLSKGEMTEVLLFEESYPDGLYAFYKVIDEVKNTYNSQEDWVKDIRNTYDIEKYI